MLETFCHTGHERTFQEMMSGLYLGLPSEVLDTQKHILGLFDQNSLLQGNS